MTNATSVDDLCALLARGASMSDDEAVDVLAHSLQCGAELADRAPGDVELQIAGLVHDIGTVLDPDAVHTHAGRGGAYVAALLGRRVGRLVALHAGAKRYLVTTDADYRGALSTRSRRTLVEQGGVMTDVEAAEFSNIEDLDAVLALRRADDAAKVAGRVVPDLDDWRDRLDQVAGAQRSTVLSPQVLAPSVGSRSSFFH